MAALIRGDSTQHSSAGRLGLLRDPGAAGLLTGLLALALITAADVTLGSDVALTGTYVLAPFLTALFGGRLATLVVAVLTLALSAASGDWNENFGSAEYVIRLVVMAAAGIVAYVAATARAESRAAMRRFQILDEVAAVADGTLPLSEVLERVTEIIVPELADICTIDVITEGRATQAAVRVEGPDRIEVEARLRSREPSTPRHMLREGGAPLVEPRFIPRHSHEINRRLGHDREDVAFLDSLGLRSSITTGFGARGRNLGALTMITTRSGRSYRGDDVRFARVLSGRVGLVLDNAGLFSDLQSVERRMDTVMSILGEAVVIQDRRGALVYANDAAGRIFGFAPEEMSAVSLEQIRNRYDLYDEEGGALEVSEFVALRVLRGQPGEDQTIRAIERDGGRELWLRARSRAIEGPGGPPMYVVTTFDDITGLKQAEFAQTMLARTGELLASSMDYRQTLQGVAGIAIPQLADWCAVLATGDEGGMESMAMAHLDAEKAQRARDLLSELASAVEDETGLAEILRRSEPAATDDVSAAIEAHVRDERQRELLRQLGIGSAMLVPMRASGEIVGALVLANDGDRRPFDEFDRQLARRLADRAAIAIANSRMASERSRIAETLQRGLAPSEIPEISGWTSAAVYRPAGAENRIGGDFYDAFSYHGGWMLVIGDVTGRGAQAAAVTALARYTIRTAGTLTGNPVSALRRLNESLRTGEGSLCTAAIVTLPVDGGELQVAIAGHPPPLVLRDGSVEEAGTIGPVLGAFEDADWQLDSFSLAPGDQLVLYTDGVIEAPGEEGRFGEETLRSRLAGSSSPATAISRVVRALEAFTVGELGDDVAMVAVMRDPVPAMTPAGAASGRDGP